MALEKKRIAHGFEKLLKEFSIAEVDSNIDPVFGLWSDMRLAYFNIAWFSFAKDNGGEPAISDEWGLGRSLYDSIPPNIQAYYQTLFKSVIESGQKKRRSPISHEYECSSASVYRRFAMLLYPLAAGKGLLVVNSLLCERPHDPGERPPNQPEIQIYADANDMIHQCVHCRRVENQRVSGRWDWVPAWVEHIPPNGSHTLCNFCFNKYYSPSTPIPRQGI
jgi:hypothetical protein